MQGAQQASPARGQVGRFSRSGGRARPILFVPDAASLSVTRPHRLVLAGPRGAGGRGGKTGWTRVRCGRINSAPVFVSPNMQWAVPNNCVGGPPGGPGCYGPPGGPGCYGPGAPVVPTGY